MQLVNYDFLPDRSRKSFNIQEFVEKKLRKIRYATQGHPSNLNPGSLRCNFERKGELILCGMYSAVDGVDD